MDIISFIQAFATPPLGAPSGRSKLGSCGHMGVGAPPTWPCWHPLYKLRPEGATRKGGEGLGGGGGETLDVTHVCSNFAYFESDKVEDLRQACPHGRPVDLEGLVHEFQPCIK
jgi:hypothetical protein